MHVYEKEGDGHTIDHGRGQPVALVLWRKRNLRETWTQSFMCVLLYGENDVRQALRDGVNEG